MVSWLRKASGTGDGSTMALGFKSLSNVYIIYVYTVLICINNIHCLDVLTYHLYFICPKIGKLPTYESLVGFCGVWRQTKILWTPQGSWGSIAAIAIGRSPTEPGELPIDIGFIFNNATRQVVRILVWAAVGTAKRRSYGIGSDSLNDHSE